MEADGINNQKKKKGEIYRQQVYKQVIHGICSQLHWGLWREWPVARGQAQVFSLNTISSCPIGSIAANVVD